MLTFNKVHAYSNLPESETAYEVPAPSEEALAQEAKRQAMLAAIQQSGGLDIVGCCQH
ncbi:hypothetical protein MD588_20330 [Photobacterium sp. SDRW27]|uniref:hypothetical protein n=1 Tax=Photobacterium obscurum TaxID=2829490 RepID=UPI002243732C|nr:hypothetical protein [Photobacterium obscurum]MCW8331146.1 hypothetical protein [Photobacterium obscurum]